MPSVNAVSKLPALLTSNAMLFLVPRPRLLKAFNVGRSIADDTDARIDPNESPGKGYNL